MKVTAEIFKKAVGRESEIDDLDRCNCTQAGEIGHWSCGWCIDHNKPRFICGCEYKKTEPFVIYNQTTEKYIKFSAYDNGLEHVEQVDSLNEATIIPFGHRKDYYIKELKLHMDLENCTLVALNVTIELSQTL